MSKNGSVISIDATITIKIKVLNLSSTKYKNYQLTDLAYTLKNEGDKAFSGKGVYSYKDPFIDKKNGKAVKTSAEMVRRTVKTKINVVIEAEVVNSIDDLGKKDHALIFVDNIPGTAVGLADEPGRIATVEASQWDGGASGYDVILHEIGHTIGLGHNEDNPNALMYPKVNGKIETNSSERGEISQNANIDYHSEEGDVIESEYTTDTKQEVNDFISTNDITTSK